MRNSLGDHLAAPQRVRWVADLVQRQLIHNWEANDPQDHFKTIRDLLLAVDD